MTEFKNALDFFEEHDRKVAAYGPIKSWLYHRSVAGKNGLWAVCHPFSAAKEIPSHCWYRAKWRHQRGKNGYATYDVWSLDHYILKWLPEAVAELRDMNHSHPMDMDNDEWIEILNTIHAGLLAGREYDDFMNELTAEENDAKLAEFESAWNLMGKHFFHLWD